MGSQFAFIIQSFLPVNFYCKYQPTTSHDVQVLYPFIITMYMEYEKRMNIGWKCEACGHTNGVLGV